MPSKNTDCTFLDVDLSENLSVPVKHEPQSLHWSHKQITVHSGILKANGEKFYHIYLSIDRNHDQQFIGVTNLMLKNTEETNGEYLFIESDNAVQYKSCQHFDIIQQICNEQNQPIIRNYGIPEHGKGEVDHVGGIGKTTLRRAIAAGIFLDDAGEMTEYLHEKFKDKEYPQYVIDEVKEEDLEIARENGRLKLYGTINGSSNFRTILFTPLSEIIKASPRICM